MFLLREIELSAARYEDITLDLEELEVTWQLPSSKTDSEAKGTSRTWGCICGHVVLPCPFQMMWQHVEWLRTWAAVRGKSVHGLPLAITESGRPATKEHMVDTFEALAAAIGERLLTTEGLRRY